MKKTFLLTIAATMAMSAMAAEVVTTPFIARGNDFAWGRMTVDGLKSSEIGEQGFCWATHENPTVDDNKSVKYYSHEGRIYRMEELTPCTQYWARAYVVTKSGETLYGEPVMFYTIQPSSLSYSFNRNDATDDVADRIDKATAGAIDAWAHSTSIQGFHVTMNWSPGTPTADCSYGGWIRMGANPSYQAIGTVLHEMNHGVGVGQHAVWYGPNSPFRATGTSGQWMGPRATDLIRFIDNDPKAYMKGDVTHMWPYGINGAHEDTHNTFDYLCHGLITQSLGEDGLPPVGGKFHQPSYCFEIEKGEKYYLKLMGSKRGASTNFIREAAGNEVVWGAMTPEEAAADDNAAWTFTFDPETQMYEIRNVATGNLLQIKTKTPKTVATPEKATFIQLTKWVKKNNWGSEKLPAYVLSSSSNTTSPYTLSVTENEELRNQSYNAFDTENYQRFMIIPSSQLLAGAAGVETIGAESAVEAAPADVYDISGRIVKRGAMDLEGLEKGIYIFRGKKIRK